MKHDVLGDLSYTDNEEHLTQTHQASEIYFHGFETREFRGQNGIEVSTRTRSHCETFSALQKLKS